MAYEHKTNGSDSCGVSSGCFREERNEDNG